MAKSALVKIGEVDTVLMIVGTDTLKPAPWNPEIRTRTRALSGLKASMMAHGFLPQFPLLVNRDGFIGDGHRRWTTAKILHIEEVPVNVFDGDLDEMWSLVNGTAMPLGGRQIMQAVVGGLKSVPNRHKAAINQLRDLVGEEGLIELANRGMSPAVFNHARRISKYCKMSTDLKFLHDVVMWIINVPGADSSAWAGIHSEVNPSVIKQAIKENRPLRAVYE